MYEIEELIDAIGVPILVFDRSLVHSTIDRQYHPCESTSRNNSKLVFMVSSVRVGAPFKSMT